MWVVIGLVLVVRTGQNVWRLFRAGDRVNEASRELAQVQAEHDRLEARLNEVRSPEFVEREAREKLGLGREGEVMLILPDQNAGASGQMAGVRGEEPNWKKWWDLYVGL